jgi:endonuclease/exonuclease/phosphatase family metal-dependent hydrolase
MGLDRAQRVTGLRPLLDEATFPAQHPTEQLDHVLVRGDVGKVGEVCVRSMPLSDHCAVTVDLV